MIFPNWIDKAVELRNNNISYNNIAKELKASKHTVSYYLKEKGFGPNEKYVRKIQNQPGKKHIDEEVFSSIDTEEKAYWLGMLYADGSIGKARDSIELALKESDKKHVEMFKSFLKSEHKIGRKEKKDGEKTHVSYRVCVVNSKIKSDLMKHGCIPNKTFTLRFPSDDIVPTDLKRHFIRGYVDGDGCITKSHTSKLSVEVLGNEEFIKEMLLYLGYDKYIYSLSKGNIKRMILSGKKGMNFLEYIYKDSTVYLDRKFDLYLKFAPLFRNE